MPELKLNKKPKPDKSTGEPKEVEGEVSFRIIYLLRCPECGAKVREDGTSRGAVLGKHKCSCGLTVIGKEPSSVEKKDGRGQRWMDTEVELRIIEYLDYHPNISGRELEKKLDLPHRVAMRCINNLISQGLIARDNRGLKPL